MTSIAIVAPHAVRTAPLGAPMIVRDNSRSISSGWGAVRVTPARSLFTPVIVFIVLLALSIQMLSAVVASRACPLMGPERSHHGLCDGVSPVCLGNSNGESCCPGSLLQKTFDTEIPVEWNLAFYLPYASFLSGILTKPALPPPIQRLSQSSVRADLPFRRNRISLGLDAQPGMEELVKKIIAALTAMVVGLGLGACSSNYGPTPSPSSVQTGPRGPGSPKDRLYHHPADPTDSTGRDNSHG